ncbi:hypothetical protein [Cryobacterium sp. 5B3]|uniref:hypothetical protein n=1 Tax=Cryobacterium sp. 5B3 TaxID=3048586 RepID=UPI002AB4A05B|nr:hypothetical protein [Cryobacterium sp. 5B3]MDY7540899.1 hypothetical protein [Cryobacterium sp. 5B3]
MKTTDLITLLEGRLAIHGDLPVVVDEPDGDCGSTKAALGLLAYPDDTKGIMALCVVEWAPHIEPPTIPRYTDHIAAEFEEPDDL